MADRENQSMNIIGAVMFGAILGSVTAYFMNQGNRQKAQEAYERLRNKGEESIDMVVDKAHDMRMKANSKAKELEDKAHEMRVKANDKSKEFEEKASENADKTKRRL